MTDSIVLRLCLGLIAACLVALALSWGPTPANGSSDGRFHTCGLVTEQGVTEHLDAYAERCGG